MQDLLTSNYPMVFVFTSIVFCAYDLTVERCQTVFARSAAKIGVIISSSIPETVRDKRVVQRR